MSGLPRNAQSAELLRWLSSFGLVLGLHGSAAAFALYWQDSSVPAPGAPPAAVLIDLAPAQPLTVSMPAATADAAADAEAQPEPEQDPPREPAIAHKPASPPELQPEPRPEPLPPDVAEFVLSTPVREVAPEPMEAAATPVADAVASVPPADSAESMAPDTEPDADTAALPASMPTAASDSGSSALLDGEIANWEAELLAHLEKHKRYPREAQWLKQEGVVELYFAMDQAGHVLEAHIALTSHSKALDREALELVTRAQPLPLPPEAMTDARVELVVPVQFALQR